MNGVAEDNNKEVILRMRDITKVYGNGVLANDHMNFELRKGEIHALMGENGAGKSTLMKVLFGNEVPDKGTIEYKGETVHIESPKKAVEMGIGMVYQHFNLAESLTVAENIVVGQEPNSGIFFDKDNAYSCIDELAQRYGFQISSKELVRNISVGQKQKVEILKILYRNSKLIILDEPTAVLTPQETDELFNQLLKLKENDYTIIFISHKIEEVIKICDRLTVIRAGRDIGTYPIGSLTAPEISKLMVGRDVILEIEKPEHKVGESILKVRDLSFYNKHGVKVVDKISFDLHKGEILGIAGVEGSGQKEVSEIITGILKCSSGNMEIDGIDVTDLSVKKIRNLGVSHIHEDRMVYGSALEDSIEENLISTRCEDKELGNHIFFHKNAIEKMGKDLTKKYGILCKSPKVLLKMLSGGNIQKVIVAREMSVNPKILVANQPTRGIDVGAVEVIHRKIIEARERDCATLLISSDLNEVLDLSDHLLVLNSGKVAGFFKDVKSLTDEELGLYMLGLKQQTEEELKGAMV